MTCVEAHKSEIPADAVTSRPLTSETGCAIMRSIACYLLDMHELVKKMPDEKGKARMFGEPKYSRNIKNKITSDGCHMNKLGNIMMAKGILKAFGLSNKKIAAAEASWLGK